MTWINARFWRVSSKAIRPFNRLSPASRAARMRRCSSPDRKSTRLNSSHSQISYAVFCLKKKRELAHLGEEVTRPFLENREHASQALAPRDGDGPRDDDEHPRTDLARPVQRFAGPLAPHGAEAAEPLDLLRAELREHLLAPGLQRRHGAMVQAFRAGGACGATPGRAGYSAARDGRGDRR